MAKLDDTGLTDMEGALLLIRDNGSLDTIGLTDAFGALKQALMDGNRQQALSALDGYQAALDDLRDDADALRDLIDTESETHRQLYRHEPQE